ncbi:ProQ/FINO family protein [Thiocystis minor]|uniref:ProQ/FINO family protein n=1 Tax=Thiocystis minor TaxID=61597 RepID=UPI001914A3B2|nr:ProQ/FINO family protein [Thiocystis minor]
MRTVGKIHVPSPICCCLDPQPADLQSLLKDAARIDLAGRPSGTVSAAEAKVVRRLLAHPLDLIAASPACFDPGQPRPLKIGIHRDLIAAGHPSLAVRLALQRDTALGQYRRGHWSPERRALTSWAGLPGT